MKASSSNLTLHHVKSFIQAKWRRFLLSSDFVSILEDYNITEYLSFPRHKREQVVYRIHILQNHPIGKTCLLKNECPCECKTSEVLLSDSTCDQGCYSEMLSKDEWNHYKYVNAFEVDLNHQKIIKYVN